MIWITRIISIIISLFIPLLALGTTNWVLEKYFRNSFGDSDFGWYFLQGLCVLIVALSLYLLFRYKLLSERPLVEILLFFIVPGIIAYVWWAWQLSHMKIGF